MVTSLQGKRIFVTEDNVGNLAILSFYLETHHVIIKVDRDGRNTVEEIRRNMPIDLILLDLMLLHNVSGFDLFDQIKQSPDLAAIPVVAISAADPDSAMTKARAKGFDGFISKPVPPTIAKYLAQVLDGKKVWITN